MFQHRDREVGRDEEIESTLSRGNRNYPLLQAIWPLIWAVTVSWIERDFERAPVHFPFLVTVILLPASVGVVL